MSCFREGDYILAVNSTHLQALPQNRVDQTLLLAPRGLVRIIASAQPLSQETQAKPQAKDEVTVTNKATSKPVLEDKVPKASVAGASGPSAFNAWRKPASLPENNPPPAGKYIYF